MKKETNKAVEKIKEFAHKNKHLLVMVANPTTDEILVGYNDKFSLVVLSDPNFPEPHVVYHALKASTFEEYIDELTLGVMKGLGVDEKSKEAVQLIKVVGGAVKSIGELEDKEWENAYEEKNTSTSGTSD